MKTQSQIRLFGLVISLSMSVAYCQIPSVEVDWQQDYSFDGINRIEPMGDGFIVLSGYLDVGFSCRAVDRNGALLWNNYLSNIWVSQVNHISGGNYALLSPCDFQFAAIVSLDSIVSQYSVFTPFGHPIIDVEEFTSDSTWTVKYVYDDTLRTFSPPWQNSASQCRWGTPTSNCTVFLQTSSGYFRAGYWPTSSVYLVTSEGCSLSWQEFSEDGLLFTDARSCRKGVAGFIFAAGLDYQEGEGVKIAKIASTGETIWQRQYIPPWPIAQGDSTALLFGAPAVAPTGDGGVAVLTRQIGFSPPWLERYLIVRFSSDGDSMWTAQMFSRPWGSSGPVPADLCAIASDLGEETYLVVGGQYSSGLGWMAEVRPPQPPVDCVGPIQDKKEIIDGFQAMQVYVAAEDQIEEHIDELAEDCEDGGLPQQDVESVDRLLAVEVQAWHGWSDVGVDSLNRLSAKAFFLASTSLLAILPFQGAIAKLTRWAGEVRYIGRVVHWISSITKPLVKRFNAAMRNLRASVGSRIAKLLSDLHGDEYRNQLSIGFQLAEQMNKLNEKAIAKGVDDVVTQEDGSLLSIPTIESEARSQGSLIMKELHESFANPVLLDALSKAQTHCFDEPNTEIVVNNVSEMGTELQDRNRAAVGEVNRAIESGDTWGLIATIAAVAGFAVLLLLAALGCTTAIGCPLGLAVVLVSVPGFLASLALFDRAYSVISGVSYSAGVAAGISRSLVEEPYDLEKIVEAAFCRPQTTWGHPNPDLLTEFTVDWQEKVAELRTSYEGTLDDISVSLAAVQSGDTTGSAQQYDDLKTAQDRFVALSEETSGFALTSYIVHAGDTFALDDSLLFEVAVAGQGLSGAGDAALLAVSTHGLGVVPAESLASAVSTVDSLLSLNQQTFTRLDSLAASLNELQTTGAPFLQIRRAEIVQEVDDLTLLLEISNPTTVDIQGAVLTLSDSLRAAPFFQEIALGEIAAEDSILLTAALGSAETGQMLLAVDVAPSANASSWFFGDHTEAIWYDAEAVIEFNLPKSLLLRQNYPNPFNATTTIVFEQPNADHTVLTVYDVLGRRVATLLDATLDGGLHKVMWDGATSSGARVGNGIYFCQLVTNDTRQTIKMVLLK